MTKNEIIKLCENELDYYNIVDECSEMVDFGAIIDFLIEKGIVKIETMKEGADIAWNNSTQICQNKKTA